MADSRRVDAPEKRPLSARPKVAEGNRNVTPGKQVPTMSKPQPFIYNDENGLLIINEKVKDMLMKLDKPIKVVAIAGKYRTGKSYLMNRLYGKNAGFPLGGTIQSKTKGIWTWARPHPHNPDHCLLLLDTEGLYDVEKGDEKHDLQIFTLAVLLSSCFVFNAQGSIDDTLVKQLHLVAELSNHIQIGSRNAQELDYEFCKYFPRFVLVVRDFFLSLQIDGKRCTPDEYLEKALQSKSGIGDKIMAYNTPRECITTYFPKRKCFVLPKPVDDDTKLKALEKVPTSALRPEFLTKSEDAIQDIWSNTSVYNIKGEDMTGKQYIVLVERYLDCMNHGGVPNIESAVNYLRDQECESALKESLAVYNNHMSTCLGKVPHSQEYLTKANHYATARAVELFNRKSMLDNEGHFTKQLIKGMKESYAQFTDTNEKLSIDLCKKKLIDIFATIQENIKAAQYIKAGGYKKYYKDKETAIKKYRQCKGLGPLSEYVLASCLNEMSMHDKLISDSDKSLSIQEKELQEQQVKYELQKQQKYAQEQRNASLKQKLADTKSHHKQLLKEQYEKYVAALDLQVNKHNELIKQKQKELMSIQGENKQLQDDKQKQIKRLETERANFEQEKQSNQKLKDAYEGFINSKRESEKELQNLKAELDKPSTGGFFGVVGCVADLLPIPAPKVGSFVGAAVDLGVNWLLKKIW